MTGSFLALARIPLALENIGDDANLDLVVNHAVAVVNELQESPKIFNQKKLGNFIFKNYRLNFSQFFSLNMRAF